MAPLNESEGMASIMAPPKEPQSRSGMVGAKKEETDTSRRGSQQGKMDQVGTSSSAYSKPDSVEETQKSESSQK